MTIAIRGAEIVRQLMIYSGPGQGQSWSRLWTYRSSWKR